jgi:hypothetical protein
MVKLFFFGHTPNYIIKNVIKNKLSIEIYTFKSKVVALKMIMIKDKRIFMGWHKCKK